MVKECSPMSGICSSFYHSTGKSETLRYRCPSSVSLAGSEEPSSLPASPRGKPRTMTGNFSHPTNRSVPDTSGRMLSAPTERVYDSIRKEASMADWLKLDNAALIFPAVRRRDWTNTFRVSATLREKIQPDMLQKAVDMLMPRFPSVYVCLHRGCFGTICKSLQGRPGCSRRAPAP